MILVRDTCVILVRDTRVILVRDTCVTLVRDTCVLPVRDTCVTLVRDTCVILVRDTWSGCVSNRAGLASEAKWLDGEELSNIGVAFRRRVGRHKYGIQR